MRKTNIRRNKFLRRACLALLLAASANNFYAPRTVADDISVPTGTTRTLSADYELDPAQGVQLLGTLNLAGTSQTIAGLSDYAAGSTTGTGAGTGVLNFGTAGGRLTIVEPLNYGYAGKLVGAADAVLVKQGAADLTLSGDNREFLGTLEIAAGTLFLKGTKQPNFGSLKLTGGSLNLATVDSSALIITHRLESAGSTTATIQIATGNVLQVGVAGEAASVNNGEFGGVIGGASTTNDVAGGALVKDGAGTLTLTGNNLYTGATTLRGGTLVLKGDGAIAQSEKIIFYDGTTLDISGTNTGATVKALDTLTADATRNSASISLGAKTLTIGGGNFDGVISGAGGIVVTAHTTLPGSNTYSGATRITGGTLAVTGSLGTKLTGTAESTALDEFNSAKLRFADAIVLNAAYTYAGDVALAGGNLSVGAHVAVDPVSETHVNGDQLAKQTFTGSVAGTGTFTVTDGWVVVEKPLTAATVTNHACLDVGVVNGNVENNPLLHDTDTTPLTHVPEFARDGGLRFTTINGDLTNKTSSSVYLVAGNGVAGTERVNGSDLAIEKFTITGTFKNAGHVMFTDWKQRLYVGELAKDTSARYVTSSMHIFVDLAHPENSTQIVVTPNADGTPGTVGPGQYNFYLRIVGDTTETDDPRTWKHLVGLESASTTTRIPIVVGAKIDPDANFNLNDAIDVNDLYELTIVGNGNATITTRLNGRGGAFLNAVGALPVSFFSQFDNVFKRVGEIRMGYFNQSADKKVAGSERWARIDGDKLESAVWMRGYSQEADNINIGVAGVAKFVQFQFGFDAGVDHAFDFEDSRLYLGVFGGFEGAHRLFRDGLGSRSNAHSFEGGAYLNWIHAQGWFFGLIAKGQIFRNSYNASRPASPKYSYDTGGFGAGAEFGKRFDFGDWFVEPSLTLDLMHVLDKKYTFDSPYSTPVEIDATTVARYGAFLRGGWTTDLGMFGAIQPFARVGVRGQSTSGGTIVVRNAAGDELFDKTPDVDGWQVLGGFGFAWQIDDASQIHFNYEAAYGTNYFVPWSVNLGYRYRF